MHEEVLYQVYVALHLPLPLLLHLPIYTHAGVVRCSDLQGRSVTRDHDWAGCAGEVHPLQIEIFVF